MRNLILTSLKIDGKYLQQGPIITSEICDNQIYLDDFIESLRTKGKYHDDIAIMFYGGCLSKSFQDAIKKYNVKLLYIDNNYLTWNYVTYHRFLDFLEYELYNNYDNIAFFDNDMWFQDDVNELWCLLPEHGCLMGGNILESDPIYLHPTEIEKIELFKSKMKWIYNKYGYYGINSGFLAGTKANIISKLIKVREGYASGLTPKIWGSDQFLLNYYFDIKNDKHDERFNYSFESPFATEKKYIKSNGKFIMNDGTIPIALHIMKIDRDRPEVFYKNNRE